MANLEMAGRASSTVEDGGKPQITNLIIILIHKALILELHAICKRQCGRRIDSMFTLRGREETGLSAEDGLQRYAPLLIK